MQINSAQKLMATKPPAHNSAKAKNKALDNSLSSDSWCSADPDNLACLYQKYKEDVSAFLRMQFGNGPPDPEDVTQTVFQRLYENRSRGKIRNIRAYLRQAARNLFLSEIDRARTREKYAQQVEQINSASEGVVSNPETVLSNVDMLETINIALEKMTAKRRRAFILHRIEGLSITETGLRMGISRTAAAKHISHAIAAIDSALVSKEKD